MTKWKEHVFLAEETGRSVADQIGEGITVTPTVEIPYLRDIKEVLEDNFPRPGDLIVNEIKTREIADGETYTFVYNVPQGHVFYPYMPRVTWIKNTKYQVLNDGKWNPEISDVIHDFSDGRQLKINKCYNKLELRVTNNSGSNQVYNVLFSGWLRKIR